MLQDFTIEMFIDNLLHLFTCYLPNYYAPSYLLAHTSKTK